MERQLYHVASVGKFSKTQCHYTNTRFSLVTTHDQTMVMARTFQEMKLKGNSNLIVVQLNAFISQTFIFNLIEIKISICNNFNNSIEQNFKVTEF